MREIKFRGFDEENNCWRYGWYTRLVEGARVFDAIICFDDDGVLTRYYIHDDATIGQFTGLKDKNGKKIFEGDVVLVEKFRKGVIRYLEKEALFAVDFSSHLLRLCDTTSDYIEIIGNIHDQKEDV